MKIGQGPQKERLGPSNHPFSCAMLVSGRVNVCFQQILPPPDGWFNFPGNCGDQTWSLFVKKVWVICPLKNGHENRLHHGFIQVLQAWNLGTWYRYPVSKCWNQPSLSMAKRRRASVMLRICDFKALMRCPRGEANDFFLYRTCFFWKKHPKTSSICKKSSEFEVVWSFFGGFKYFRKRWNDQYGLNG